MKLFQKLWKKKEKQKEIKQEPRAYSFTGGDYKNPETRRAFIQESCELINEAKRQNFEIKKEYEVVTSYLADIQRIDMLSKEARAPINDCARKILNLNQERVKMQRTPAKITIAQRNALEPYEKTMPEEMRRMEEYEKYQQIINSDLRQLESEKASLDYEINDTVERSEVERKLLIVAGVFCGSIACLLLILQEFTEKDVQIPFLLAVATGIFIVGYFVLMRRKHIYEIRIAEKKKNRAIYLLNKVKIKYINCTGLLEYSYEKFHVENSKELHYHWQEYMRLIDEERRFQKAAELIDFYNNELINELKKQGVFDAPIWVYQCEALLDEKEMVEVRHRLNVRRQKLRQQIDYNNGQGDAVRRAIQAFIEKYPEYELEAKDILMRNEIELSYQM